mgnify:FL=1
MAQVTLLEATVPVLSWSGYDYGAYAVQNALKAKGYYATVTPRQGSKTLYVVLKKSGGGEFDDAKAKSAIQAATSAVGTKLAALKDWLVTTAKAGKENVLDLTPSAIAKTTTDALREQKAEYDACIAKGGSALTCGPGVVGLPKWIVPAGIGLALLLLVGQVASIKRSFSGLGTGNLSGLGCVHRGRARRGR